MSNHELPEELSILLAFIRGEGPWRHDGRGLHTHPGKDDEDANQAHAACLDLESRGLIVRHFTGPGHVVWMPSSRAEA